MKIGTGVVNNYITGMVSVVVVSAYLVGGARGYVETDVGGGGV